MREIHPDLYHIVLASCANGNVERDLEMKTALRREVDEGLMKHQQAYEREGLRWVPKPDRFEVFDMKNDRVDGYVLNVDFESAFRSLWSQESNPEEAAARARLLTEIEETRRKEAEAAKGFDEVF